MKNQSVTSNLDWVTVFLYILLVLMGWVTIYSSSQPIEETSFSMSEIYGRQLLFIMFSIPLIIIVLSINAKVYEKYALIFYILATLLLAGLFIFGKTIKGQTNWYQFGGFSLQPSEFAKIGTALLIAKFLSDTQINLAKVKHQMIAFGIILLPVLMILKQPDTGSALIFFALILVLNREGLPEGYLISGVAILVLFFASLLTEPLYILPFIFLLILLQYFRTKRTQRNPILSFLIFIGMSLFVFSVDFVYDEVLEPHQKDRIDVLFNDNVNMQKEGYNLNQSMIAIGSGGLTGKGFLEGTQTKGGFVPEQHTDYIFTTVGEEWGFVGSTFVVVVFVLFFLRLIYLAENQKTKFSRVYGYCVATLLFTHFFVNITMLIKLFPTIGVPLPFFSYGGSSLWAFTILLFIFTIHLNKTLIINNN
jgi:rod shape determining protein RodA